MKKQKVFTICLAVVITAGLVLSCNKDETASEQARYDVEQPVTVKELTELLKIYNSALYYDGVDTAQPMRTTRAGLTGKDKISIAIADVKGGIRGGLRGGIPGAVLGAAINSLVKFAWIYVKKEYLTNTSTHISAGPSPIAPRIFAAGSTPVFGDSVGYYHNMIEADMYAADKYSYQRSSEYLLGNANSILNRLSASYVATGGLTEPQIENIINDINAFREADTDDLSFDGYCELLKSLNPEDSDYIDFAAEYLYIAFYGNVDLEDYTEEVMFMISNSNVADGDADMLRRCIQVAYASVLFSNNAH